MDILINQVKMVNQLSVVSVYCDLLNSQSPKANTGIRPSLG